MDGIYAWVRNIVYYLIFMTIITNLLPAGKYEKYLRLFAGCILILLVMKPLTGSLRLEEKINAIFRSVSFENEAGELKGELDGMEQKRLDRLIGSYEASAEEELIRMAGEEGIEAVAASVVIEGDSRNPDFGKVKKIALRLKKTEETADAQENADGGRTKTAKEDRITLEKVEKVSVRLDGSGQDRNEESLRDSRSGDQEQGKSDVEAAGKVIATAQENEMIRQFRRTIAGYYQMEEENVEIGLED
ncbi:stage III sporulation protein AF [[Clostridium] symbiosum]|uniref:stage III sporulation protein AF n=1 Tax=Clostridium symbiosum TaxID=1512 RepID=UPI001D06E3CB|nr:stage III sporulation protein AF [[Clostridium] symbiosum]MCB6610983.1 stage III sporulation protein AF [[Clostridium] symbiosum]MCB6931553.1 stage III sporulation protein AF [[Clostridium] symbiosum]